MSLHQYFHYNKNFELSRHPSTRKYIIPHYVGAKSVPTYPPTESYARAVIIMHVPWNNTLNELKESKNYVEAFKIFLKSPECPISVKVGYERAKTRYQQNKKFVEPTGKRENINYESFSTNIDEGVEEIVALASTLGLSCALNTQEDNEYFYGDESTDWSKQHYKV